MCLYDATASRQLTEQTMIRNGEEYVSTQLCSCEILSITITRELVWLGFRCVCGWASNTVNITGS